MESSKNQTECCPIFDPTPWDGQLIEWENKKFVKTNVCTLFYMPLNFGGVMKKMTKKLASTGATMPFGMCLSDHTTKWNMNIYLHVDKDVPNAENVTMSGKFLCKVYEGNFKETGNWCKDFDAYAKSRSLEITKWYMWYTTCPKCAKKYGKNYVVIIGRIR